MMLPQPLSKATMMPTKMKRIRTLFCKKIPALRRNASQLSN
nr:hypothetical protein [Escherichia marmotae]